MAEADPESFEMRRRKTIERFLMTSSSRQRMLGECLQREIDSERNRAQDSRESFHVITRMLCEQLIFLGEGVTDLSNDMKRLDRSKLLVDRCLLFR